MKHILIYTFLFVCSYNTFAQFGSVSGRVFAREENIIAASVTIPGLKAGAISDSAGLYLLDSIPAGNYKIVATALGYKKIEMNLKIQSGVNTVLDLDFESLFSSLDQVVITGTRTPKRRTNSPVIVNLINSKTLDQVVAINLSDGLKFQPGLRVETDCQTCNYTQLRINGLQGGYSQILINSRSVFSPLMGLYGMEQIPTNMIDRIEVVRGGVSALYGSSAIGGTVNVITKFPATNSYELTNTYQNIKGQTSDNSFTGNATLINDKKNMGISFFVNNRYRGLYDANKDNYSELPSLRDNTFGTNLFFLPAKNQKLEISLSSINEYRYGGEQVNKAAYLAQQSEERLHNVLMGSAAYSISFYENRNSVSFYYGGQTTDRKHYTGIIPDDSADIKLFFANPPYGISDVSTHQGGVQYNTRFKKFLKGKALLTTGAEYIYDAVYDEIEAYRYKVDQTTKSIGLFAQNDWDISDKLNMLTGFRIDKHNLVDHVILSPRISLLYKLKETTQIRFGWGTGFRAPQAFDTDLHIAFAAGGVSRISLANDLKEERSGSFTGSLNYDKATEHFIAGFTIEGFYTKLNDAFYQYPVGIDNFGQLFEKRNGTSATVKGITLETRANFDYVYQLEAGFTLQSSKFGTPVENIAGLVAKREFLRTPNDYGYATFSYTPTKKWGISANAVYTGKMQLAHFAGVGTGQNIDEYVTTNPFLDLGIRLNRKFDFANSKTGLEVFSGLKNIFDAYQKNFDTGKNRDSNFVYGPSIPRTVFIGLRIKSI